MKTMEPSLSSLQQDPERLFDTNEAAEIYRKSKQWFERHRWAGTGPKYIKIGRTPYYRAADLLEWIKQPTEAD